MTPPSSAVLPPSIWIARRPPPASAGRNDSGNTRASRRQIDAGAIIRLKHDLIGRRPRPRSHCNHGNEPFPPTLLSSQQQEQDPTNLYISNLPVSMDEQELESMLKPFGHVISTRILRDAGGVSRGVGFARSAPRCFGRSPHWPNAPAHYGHTYHRFSVSHLLFIYCVVKPPTLPPNEMRHTLIITMQNQGGVVMV